MPPELPRGDLKCRFGCDDPVALYSIPVGCWCWTDPVQALCAQHSQSVVSAGPVTQIATLTPKIEWSEGND